MTGASNPSSNPVVSGAGIVGDNRARDRLATAQWVFERHLAWIAAAEVKVGVIVAIETAMLGGLAAVFSIADIAARTSWAYLVTLSAAGASAISILCAAMVLMPRTSGPDKSLLFFAKIAELSDTAYSDRFSKSSTEELLSDWTRQIYRNAQIAKEKYWWVARSIGWAFGSALPWILAIGTLVKI